MVIKKHLAKLVAVAAAAAIGQTWPAHEHCFGLAIGIKDKQQQQQTEPGPSAWA